MLGCISMVAVIAAAVAAGLGQFSFWWVAIPAFVAGAFSISNGPGYSLVMRANAEGRLSVFPLMLATHTLGHLALAGAAFGLTRVFS
ncbi:MAG: hypothetical protein ACK4GG_00450 [Sphingomonas sp.]